MQRSAKENECYQDSLHCVGVGVDNRKNLATQFAAADLGLNAWALGFRCSGFKAKGWWWGYIIGLVSTLRKKLIEGLWDYLKTGLQANL